MPGFEFDVFISHASEDKAQIARPLAEHLKAMGYRVWFDEFELLVGDSLSAKIDKGLASSRFGIVILSKHFFDKRWPARELAGLTAAELSRDVKVLPVWHGLTHADVAEHSPVLADRVAVVSTLGLEGISRKLSEAMGPPTGPPQPLRVTAGRRGRSASSPPEELALDHATFKAMVDRQVCPQCEQSGRIFGFDGSDGDELDWFECSHCGYFHVLHSIPS